MKLYILGNGFDKHLGFETGYTDFFNHESIKKIKNEVQKELNEFNESMKPYTDVYSAFVYNKMLKNKLKNSSTNIIFTFLYCKKEAGIVNWSDVEYQIKSLLIDVCRCGHIINQDKEEDLYRLIDNSNIEFFRYFHARLRCLEGVRDYRTVLHIIYEELIEFEKIFSKYLEEIQNNKSAMIQSDDFQNKIECFFRHHDYVENEYISILSFNYTTYLKTINCFFEETGRGKLFNTLDNIHGRINTINDATGTTIFGIDYNDFSDNDNEISRDIRNLFSKTARVLLANTHEKNNILPQNIFTDDKKLEIIIFGHSLASADYSYFQSIFDYYDLYNNNRVSVCLRYTNFEKRNPVSVKSEWVEKLMNLLETYGGTLDNKEHGKNLTHKLLIENRLRIEYFV